MKFFNTFVILVLVITAALTVLAEDAVVRYSGTCGEAAIWSLDSDGVLTISGSGEMTNFGSISSTPWNPYRDDIKKVVIGEGITTVGSLAFKECQNLTQVDLGNTVKTIYSEAFSVNIGLKEVNIPDSVTVVEPRAFGNNYNLEYVYIGSGVELLYSTSFEPSAMKEYVVSEENENYCSVEGVLFDKSMKKLIRYPRNKALEVYDVPQGVEVLGYECFKGTSLLGQVNICQSVEIIEKVAFEYSGVSVINIEEGVSEIQDYAFSSCTSLREIHLPSTVRTIGEEAFFDCKALEVVYIEDVKAWCEIDFETSYSNPLVFKCLLYVNSVLANHLEIPVGTKEIPSCAFIGGQFVSVSIPDSVESIGERAFFSCTELTGVEIPESVTYIGESAFTYCFELFSAKILANIDTLPKNAFRYCTSLERVELPDSLKTVGELAFGDCSSLESLMLPYGTERIGRFCFNYCTALETIVIPDTLVSIACGAFCRCDSFSAVFYSSSNEKWDEIDYLFEMNYDNAFDILDNADFYFNYTYPERDDESDSNNYLHGDINGDRTVNNRDAARLMQHIAGWDVEVVQAVLDVNGDGTVNNRDAARIMQYLAGWDVEWK